MLGSGRVEIPDDLLYRCEAFAAERVKPETWKRTPRSAALTYGDAQTNELTWVEAKMAECGACLSLGIDPRDPASGFNWSSFPDDWDFLSRSIGGMAHVDVKETKTPTLLWSVNKKHLFEKAKFDILLSATARRLFKSVLLHGWLSKSEFWKRHKVSEGGEDEPREPGTWYVPRVRLHRMEIFPGHCDDEREKYCWCGNWSFGSIRGNRGEWYCNRHRPRS